MITNPNNYLQPYITKKLVDKKYEYKIEYIEMPKLTEEMKINARKVINSDDRLLKRLHFIRHLTRNNIDSKDVLLDTEIMCNELGFDRKHLKDYVEIAAYIDVTKVEYNDLSK